MRIIDLLNKIANGEEVPKEIYYKKQWWEYNPDNDYEGTDWGGCFLNNVLICDLNDEVIVEESKEGIIRIGTSFETNYLNNDLQSQIVTVQHNCALAVAKIDELVDAINELRKEK